MVSQMCLLTYAQWKVTTQTWMVTVHISGRIVCMQWRAVVCWCSWPFPWYEYISGANSLMWMSYIIVFHCNIFFSLNAPSDVDVPWIIRIVAPLYAPPPPTLNAPGDTMLAAHFHIPVGTLPLMWSIQRRLTSLGQPGGLGQFFNSA